MSDINRSPRHHDASIPAKQNGGDFSAKKTFNFPASSGGVRNSYGEIRLNLVRDVVDYNDDCDIDFLKRTYKRWVKRDEYLLVQKEEGFKDYSKSKCKWLAVKCSKRGNDVYQHRVKDRFESMFDIFKSGVKCVKKPGIKKTNTLYITLTYDTKLKSRAEAWENIGVEWNRFLSALKKKYGNVEEIRTWETFENGYPHIHTVVIFEKKVFDNAWLDKKAKWRINSTEKDAIADLWHSFVDIQAVFDIEEAVVNVVWYAVKSKSCSYKNIEDWGKKELLTTMACWFFRKRSYSISGNFTDLIDQTCIIQTNDRVQTTLEGKKAVVKYEVVGIIARKETEIDSYTWCKTYKKAPKWFDKVHKMKCGKIK